jgi:hypothetical protein
MEMNHDITCFRTTCTLVSWNGYGMTTDPPSTRRVPLVERWTFSRSENAGPDCAAAGFSMESRPLVSPRQMVRLSKGKSATGESQVIVSREERDRSRRAIQTIVESRPDASREGCAPLSRA